MGKTSKYIEEMKNLRKEDELLDKAFKEVPDTSEDKTNETDSNKKGIDFTSLKSLEKDGIDMSFLESLQKYNDQSTDLIEVKTEDIKQENLELLQTNAQLIDQLKMVQNERLSGTPLPISANCKN